MHIVGCTAGKFCHLAAVAVSLNILSSQLKVILMTGSYSDFMHDRSSPCSVCIDVTSTTPYTNAIPVDSRISMITRATGRLASCCGYLHGMHLTQRH